LRRRKQIRRFVDKSKDLFKINSQVRDFDVISEIIGMNGNPQKHENMIIPKNFEARRTLNLKKAMNVAVGLRKLPLPKIKKSSVSSSKVNRRFNKLIRKYSSRIQLNLPLVMTDANKVTELHEMRKDCKKLRYVFESIPHNNTSNNSLLKLEEDLENMQDKLGEIHDCDATVAYLKKSQKKSRMGKDVIKNIMEERKKRYEEFLVLCKSDILNNKHRSELFDIPKPAYNTSKQ
jgi:CHAD domain-containing protein